MTSKALAIALASAIVLSACGEAARPDGRLLRPSIDESTVSTPESNPPRREPATTTASTTLADAPTTTPPQREPVTTTSTTLGDAPTTTTTLTGAIDLTEVRDALEDLDALFGELDVDIGEIDLEEGETP